MVKRRNRRGQSVLEYLVIITAVVLAIMVFRGTVQTRVEGLGTTAVNQINATQTLMGNIKANNQI